MTRLASRSASWPGQGVVLAALIVACGPKSPGEATETDAGTTGEPGTSSSSSGVSTTTSGVSTTTTGVSTTTTGVSTTTTGEPTTGGPDTMTDGPDTGDVLCPSPDEEPVKAGWALEISPPQAEFSAPCMVVSAAPNPEGQVVAFECTQDGNAAKVELSYARTPNWELGAFVPGTTFIVTYREEMPFWKNAWFTVRHEWGTLLLAGISADAAVPPGVTPEEFFSIPIAMKSPGCPEIEDSCGVLERGALAVQPFGNEVLVFDGQHRSIIDLPGDVVVWAEEVTALVSVQCDDVPETSIRALFEAHFGP